MLPNAVTHVTLKYNFLTKFVPQALNHCNFSFPKLGNVTCYWEYFWLSLRKANNFLCWSEMCNTRNEQWTCSISTFQKMVPCLQFCPNMIACTWKHIEKIISIWYMKQMMKSLRFSWYVTCVTLILTLLSSIFYENTSKHNLITVWNHSRHPYISFTQILNK